MIKPLEDAIARIRHLPEDEQALLARFVLHELDEDDAWRRSSETHGASLERLFADVAAEEARTRKELRPLFVPDQNVLKVPPMITTPTRKVVRAVGRRPDQR